MVVHIYHAHGHETHVGGSRSAGEVTRGEVGANVDHVPTLHRRDGTDERRTDDVPLAGRCRDQDPRRIVSARERAHRLSGHVMEYG